MKEVNPNISNTDPYTVLIRNWGEFYMVVKLFIVSSYEELLLTQVFVSHRVNKLGFR